MGTFEQSLRITENGSLIKDKLFTQLGKVFCLPWLLNSLSFCCPVSWALGIALAQILKQTQPTGLASLNSGTGSGK